MEKRVRIMWNIIKLLSKLGIIKTGNILTSTGKALDNKKAYGSGVIYILLSLIGILITMWPDILNQVPILANIVPKDMDPVTMLATGIGVIGVAHKLAKQKAATDGANETQKEVSDKLGQLIEILGGDTGQVLKVVQEMEQKLQQQDQEKKT